MKRNVKERGKRPKSWRSDWLQQQRPPQLRAQNRPSRSHRRSCKEPSWQAQKWRKPSQRTRHRRPRPLSQRPNNTLDSTFDPSCLKSTRGESLPRIQRHRLLHLRDLPPLNQSSKLTKQHHRETTLTISWLVSRVLLRRRRRPTNHGQSSRDLGHRMTLIRLGLHLRPALGHRTKICLHTDRRPCLELSLS